MKPFYKSKTLGFNVAVFSFPFLFAVLVWLQTVLSGEGFQEVLIVFLAALGIDVDSAYVASVVMVTLAVIGIVLRFVTVEPVTISKVEVVDRDGF